MIRNYIEFIEYINDFIHYALYININKDISDELFAYDLLR